MKKNLYLAILLIAICAVFTACNQKEEVKKSEPAIQKWAEEDDFHIVMAETFHPMDNDSNFTPIKTRSKELVEAAQKWINSKPPFELEHPEGCAEALVKLVSASEALHNQIQAGASDEEIRKSLTALHDLFHEASEESAPKGTGHNHKH
ncbi:MAG: hypothetical protein SFU91_02465 [Chloroherpetonaceae bacterium]|nr:hypothetical protein [Chloroherpetonaceae bacterium]